MLKNLLRLQQNINHRILMNQLKPRIDRIGWILISLSVIFYFIIPLPYYVYTFSNHVYSIPYSRFIVWVSQGLGILSAIAFGAYQIHRENHLKK